MNISHDVFSDSSIQVRKDTIKRYNWDDTAKVWENYIDSYKSKGLQGKWDTPPQITNIPQSIPPDLSNEAFINWIFSAILNDPEKAYTNEAADLHRSLMFGANMGQGSLEPINRDQIFENYKQVAINKNNMEMLRTGNIPIAQQQFILTAHERKKRTI